MNDDNFLVRPLFRVLYGIVSAFCVWGIYLGVVTFVRMLSDKVLSVGGLLTWFIIVFQLFLIWFAYTTFVVALRGKPPKYLAKYLEKYQKKIDQN